MQTYLSRKFLGFLIAPLFLFVPFSAFGCESAANPLVVEHSIFSDEFLGQLTIHYPTAQIKKASDDQSEVIVTELDAKNREQLLNDLSFYRRNPTLPLENAFASLDNYLPQNDTQKEALKWARRLVESNLRQGSGLFLSGQAGLGKTHLSVAVAKELFRRGKNVLYLNSNNSAEVGRYIVESRLDPYDVIILDDFNSGFHCMRDAFRNSLFKVHAKGGKLFVTSNSPFSKIFNEAIDNENRARFADRAKTVFKVLELQGESYRQATGWFSEEEEK